MNFNEFVRAGRDYRTGGGRKTQPVCVLFHLHISTIIHIFICTLFFLPRRDRKKIQNKTQITHYNNIYATIIHTRTMHIILIYLYNR